MRTNIKNGAVVLGKIATGTDTIKLGKLEVGKIGINFNSAVEESYTVLVRPIIKGR